MELEHLDFSSSGSDSDRLVIVTEDEAEPSNVDDGQLDQFRLRMSSSDEDKPAQVAVPAGTPVRVSSDYDFAESLKALIS